ncbi:MAG: MBL fold metallo-hydrolase [archaeon]
MIAEGIEIEWLGHDGFLVKSAGTVLCFDPFEANASAKADFIFISHEHHDHLSPKDIEAFRKPSTVIIASESCRGKIADAHFLKPEQSIEIAGIKVRAVRAYNTNKFRSPGVHFHPKENNGIGFVVEFAGKRVYHAGDTDFIPEMKKLGSIDVAFLPVSGTYVMTPEEAAEAANAIKPKTAIPMHYGKIVGTKSDAEKFASLYKGKTEILG